MWVIKVIHRLIHKLRDFKLPNGLKSLKTVDNSVDNPNIFICKNNMKEKIM